MINYWIICLLFIPIGIIYRPDLFPGSIIELILNLTAANSSYNSAWWFLLPYVILVLGSQPLIRQLMQADKRQTKCWMVGLLVLYVATYIAKDYISKAPEILPSITLTIVNALYFLFIFSLGVLAYKYDIFSRLRSYIDSHPPTPMHLHMLGILILLCILRISLGKSALLHFPFVCLMLPIIVLLPKPQWFIRSLLFWGKHSTNMWLCHYFFINYLLDCQIYYLRYPLLIWAALMIASLFTSIIVIRVFEPIKKNL